MKIIELLILGLIVAIVYKFFSKKVEKFFNVPQDKLYFIYAKTCGNLPNVERFETSFNSYASSNPKFKERVQLKVFELQPNQVEGCVGITADALEYKETPVGLGNILASLEKGQSGEELQDSEIVKQALLISNQNGFQGGYQLPLIVYVPKGIKEIKADNMYTDKAKDFYTNSLDDGVPGPVYRNEMGEMTKSNVYIVNWMLLNFWKDNLQLIDENTN
jgi:hypothetical protein